MTTKTPQDHLPPKTAAQREAERDGTVTITWRDQQFTIPAVMDDLPGEFLEYSEEGKATKMVAVVLGSKQFRAFKEAKPKPKVRDYNQLADQIAEVYGFGDAGE